MTDVMRDKEDCSDLKNPVEIQPYGGSKFSEGVSYHPVRPVRWPQAVSLAIEVLSLSSPKGKEEQEKIGLTKAKKNAAALLNRLFVQALEELEEADGQEETS